MELANAEFSKLDRLSKELASKRPAAFDALERVMKKHKCSGLSSHAIHLAVELLDETLLDWAGIIAARDRVHGASTSFRLCAMRGFVLAVAQRGVKTILIRSRKRWITSIATPEVVVEDSGLVRVIDSFSRASLLEIKEGQVGCVMTVSDPWSTRRPVLVDVNLSLTAMQSFVA
jgi:hypothetical protein